MSRPHVPVGAAQVLTDSLQELEHVGDKDVNQCDSGTGTFFFG